MGPLRAFETELGVQAPLGFWDPLGLSKDGDVPTFKRRRATEIKHGRVSMLAFLGWFQILLYGAYVESGADFGGDVKNTPGDVGFKPPLMAVSSDKDRERRLNSELANGRLAMMAIIGMFFQDGLTGSAWGDWALYTSSPLR